MDTQTPITPLEPGVEMFQRGKTDSLLFVPRTDKPRPVSEVTEMYDTDFEDDNLDDGSSEFEEFAANYEFNSNEGRRSQTTISTFEEVSTPHSSRRSQFDLQIDVRKSVEGPRGPHLFRASHASSIDSTFDYALQLSPVFQKEPPRADTAFTTFSSDRTITTITGLTPHPSQPIEPVVDANDASTWTTQDVAMWMYRCAIDYAIIEQFEANDINGTVLLDLQFEDLKELGIQSFGKRHQLWNQICALRNNEGRVSPIPTPFQDLDAPYSEPRRSNSSANRLKNQDSCGDFSSGLDDAMTPITPGGRKRRGRKHRNRKHDDIITPAESVSIVAIEQLLPKPHKCAKGERCAKWRKQQRLLKRLHDEHGYPISPEHGGQIFIAGDPGNASNAANIVDNVHRPTSEAIPSVVASSDILGPEQTPEFALQEELLRTIGERDPQENVKAFLNFQHVDPPHMVAQTPIEAPPSPTYEMFPAQPTGMVAPHQHLLQNLPRLSIPRSSSAQPTYANTPGGCYSAVDQIYSPYHALSSGIHRYGTPASEMDVPTTAIPLGPISRETSQSVPPGMQFRDPVNRTSSRAADWRRPSFALPRLAEHEVFSPVDDTATLRGSRDLEQSNAAYGITKEKVTPITLDGEESPYPGTTHSGWMKKRKTRLLRHDWEDKHFRLNGANLAMHADALPSSRPLDTLNIDEYAVACSSLASGKLAAKLKALKIATGTNKKDGPEDAAFSFQLVPAGKDGEGQTKVRRVVAGGKTHHFAVKTRDERIDWMRELMLAKALRAKNEGYEVQVNGNMV
ncbi:hypothetical protein K402DRAFT_353366 [Aulographum hederae CBS 113979]|uniref:SAM and PH domain-containing protein n=1 Tax=Aulographum hederae CBS 113979 TaxID=1176131 RepID=A0A6G1H466_9PEZI|nr:hypothetical protein K402DRAFT_353366 [Aulographum hederae CBS 113979]